ncbi:hypothetical protein GAYE_SCF12G3386 [Galdieria yellowstonensis]|uniref:Reverse transcriptase domain-containing protein n=1 Tax=Galdieria yellowstonensis TaxID=3028027 RepID=A0AAV9IE11_9RHOD|nr:hypothetical protein GAYE_SCF12G3386 [Galdieria yellowstonensis]
MEWKAFDRIPPDALFRKLESLGIEGGCLELYCGLYQEQDWMILHLVFCSIWSSIINGTSAENRLPGMMFADDVVLLDRSWIVWKPPCAECGFAVIHGCIDKISRRQWQLQGKDTSVVEEHRHLRIDLNTSLTAEGFIV